MKTTGFEADQSVFIRHDHCSLSTSMNFQILSKNESEYAMAGYPNRPVKVARSWHALEAPLVNRLLRVNTNQGLTTSEAATRRRLYVANKSDGPGIQRLSGMLVLLCLSVVIGFLVTTAILNSAVTDSRWAIAILVVCLLGMLVGLANVFKSARLLDAMGNATQANVHVKREGHDTVVKADELVVGDIVILNPGDCVPADARLIEAAQLRALEFALTGKSTVVEKLVSPVATDTPLDRRQSMVYLGTTVLSGHAVAAVVATGLESELGRRATVG
jgi:Ca2+-transporting ATPase